MLDLGFCTQGTPDTVFCFTALGWLDSDGALTYQFSVRPVGAPAVDERFLSSAQLAVLLQTTLLPGFYVAAVRITDPLGTSCFLLSHTALPRASVPSPRLLLVFNTQVLRRLSPAT
jgi:hypothetical protein